jgi:hypothetical protein
LGASPQTPVEKTKEKMIKPKRTKEIKIRLTEQEHQDLLQRKKGELAVWIRNTCLEQEISQPKTVKTADPELLRQLAKIGGNLNQIAKATNTEQARGDIINLLRVTAELATIREQLDELLEHHR